MRAIGSTLVLGVTAGCRAVNPLYEGVTARVDSAAIRADSGSPPRDASSAGRDLVAASSSLVGYWPFDDGPGSITAADATGGGNPGLLRGFDARTAWVPGKRGGALRFGGMQWVEVAASPRLDALARTNAFTATAWVQWGGPGPTRLQAVISRQYRATQWDVFNVGLGYGKPYAALMNYATMGNECYGQTPLTPGRWTHLAYSFDGHTARIWIDGESVCHLDLAMAMALEPDTTPLAIGANNDDDPHVGEQLWSGAIDDVALFSRALTADELRALAGGTAPDAL